MKDQSKTKQVLIRELASLRQRNAELEQSEAEHKQVEETLQESEKLYRTLIETTRDLIYTTDRKGFLTYLNPTLERALGFAHDEWNGKSFAEILAPEFVDKARDIFRRSMKGESIPVYETDLIRKDGTRISVEFNVTTLLDKEGKPTGRYGIGRDITDRKRAEDALKKSEEKYRNIFETIMEGIYQTTPEGRFVIINPSFAAICGYASPEEMMEKVTDIPNQLYANPEDRLRFQKRIAADGRVQGFEVQFKHPTKGLVWVSIHSKAIRDEQGNIRYYDGTIEDITERKRAEDAFRDAHRRLDEIIEFLPDAMFVIDADKKVIAWNRAIEQMTGVPKAEMIGKGDYEYALPFYGERRPILIDLALLPDVEFEKGKYDISQRTADTIYGEVYVPKTYGGKGAYLYAAASRLRDAAGNIVGAIESIRDITERKKTEEALREGEEKYRAIIENMQEGYHEVDIKGNFTFLNESMCKMLGYEREELLGMNNRQYADEENTRKVYQVYNRVYRTGEPVKNFEWQIIRKDGDRRDIEVSISLIRDAEGHPTGFRGIVRDITERKRAEEKLRESEEQYRLLVENANDAIFIAQDGVIKFPNSKTVETLGYTAEELARIPLTQHIHTEDRDIVVARHRKRLQGESLPPVYSFRVLNRSGKEFWFEINAVQINWEGRPATLNFMRDVTEQKRLEAQLIQAQKMEAVGTLAGGLAHDFNNLLTGILGNASLAKTGMDPSDQNYGRIQNIETIVESAAGLTRQLLAFSRGGRVEVRASNINEVIEKTATIFSRTRKEVALHQNLDKDLWPAEVDRGQMEQVFMNLFVNAWQAMPGGGNLYLDTVNTVLTETDLKHPYMKPGRYVKVSVTDTGTGMDAKTRARIFEPFFTTKEMGRGTGLGLAMVYGIIKGHNGYINVYSEPGHGTTFSIYLPASEKEVPREAPLFKGILRGTETILIVDDEQMNLNVSKEVLELLGYAVYTASSGTEALAMYTGKKGEIDLILLDMIMPGMSGGETYDRMKELNPDIRVILCSGYSIDGDAQKIMDRGCKGFIQKPFNLSDLSQKIREALDKKN
jgi:two-component system cell cycle sensor histidine kinase/response regulator CckA